MRLVHGTLTALALAAMGCASGGGAAGGGTADEPQQAVASGDSYERDVGLATIRDLDRISNRIFERYQYEIERFDQGAYTFIDTRWKDRQVLPDEAALGVTAAQTRILLRTRLRSRATDEVLAVHRVTFRAENQVRRGASAEWEFGVLTEGFDDYIGRIALQFETEFRAGIRR